MPACKGREEQTREERKRGETRGEYETIDVKRRDEKSIDEMRKKARKKARKTERKKVRKKDRGETRREEKEKRRRKEKEEKKIK